MFNCGYSNCYYNGLWDNHWRSYRINSEAAIQIALQRVPGQVVKVELDIEDGILVYDIHVRSGYVIYDIHIDAATGQVLKVEREND